MNDFRSANPRTRASFACPVAIALFAMNCAVPRVEPASTVVRFCGDDEAFAVTPLRTVDGAEIAEDGGVLARKREWVVAGGATTEGNRAQALAPAHVIHSTYGRMRLPHAVPIGRPFDSAVPVALKDGRLGLVAGRAQPPSWYRQENWPASKQQRFG